MVSKILLISATMLAVAFLVIGITTLFVFPNVLNDQMSFVKSSKAYDQWVHPDFTVYMRFHFYNYTNAEELLSLKDTKPKLEYVGQLTYREDQFKHNISYHDDNKRAIYINDKTYFFEEEQSTISPHQKLVLPNILLFTICSYIPTAVPIPFAQSIAYGALNTKFKTLSKEERNDFLPFTEVEAENLLWGTQDNQLLVFLNSLNVPGVPTIPTKFGIQLNGTDDGLYEIYTGWEDANKNRGDIFEYNKSPKLTYWNSEYCNMINGTDGTTFPVSDEPKDRLYLFNSQLCRSVYLSKTGSERVDGIQTAKYSAPPELLSITMNEENVCYCKDGEKSLCLPDGLLDVSDCLSDQLVAVLGQKLPLSAILSLPEFLYSSPEQQATIEGFHPSVENHSIYLNVEPSTGLPLKAAKRIQFNSKVTVNQKMHNNMKDILQKLPAGYEYIMPVFWAEEELPLSSKLTDTVKTALRLKTGVTVSSYVMVALGILLLVAVVLAVIFGDKKNHAERKALIS